MRITLFAFAFMMVTAVVACLETPPTLETGKQEAALSGGGGPPLCSTLGCDNPSGTPDIWSPCTGNGCYCRVPPPASAMFCPPGTSNCAVYCNVTAPGGGDPSGFAPSDDPGETNVPPPVPSCASLGCPVAPSGTPDIWTPCTGNDCYCGNPARACKVKTLGDSCPHC